jgi:PAS domain S-box-containing protein
LLIAPSATLQNLTQRRQAKFLAAVLMVLVPAVFITSLLQDIVINNGAIVINRGFWIMLVTIVFYGFAYILSRTGYYQCASYLVVGTTSLAIFGNLFPNSVLSVQTLSFLVLPLLFSSILLSVRTTVICMLLQMVVLVVMASGHPQIDWSAIYSSLRLQLFAGLLSLLGMYFRNQIAHEQAALIQENEARLLQTNEELEAKVADRTAAYQIAAESLLEMLKEQENYELELAKERNLLRTVIDNVPDHIFVLDREGKYILVNNAVHRNLALNDTDTILGKTAFDYFPTEQAQQYFDEEQSIIESGHAKLNVEQTSKLTSKRRRYYLASKLPLREPSGEITGIVGIAHDVTERKEAEKILQQSNIELENRVAERTAELSKANELLREQMSNREQAEAQLRYQASLLENVSDAIISVDVNFIVRTWNKAAEKMYGWTEAEAIGSNAFKMTSAVLAVDTIEKLMGEVIQLGYWQGESEDKRKDGTKLNVMSSITILKDASGNVQGMVLVNRDVTERKQVEAAEHEQRLLAEALRDTSAAISSTLKLSEILDLILIYVERVLPYDSASIMLVHDHVARVVHGHGFEERGMNMQEILALRFSLDDHENLMLMYKNGDPIIIPDTSLYPNWRKENATNWIMSYIGAPIRIEGSVIGFINLDSAVPASFNQSHAEKLQAFADQAGIAIHNANLFEAISQHATDMENRVAVRTAELVNERAQLQAILDAMTEGVFGVLFGEKPIRYANRSFQLLTGYTSDDWSFDLLKPQTSDEASDFVHDIDKIYDSLTSGKVWEGRGPVRRKDGKVFDAHVLLTRIDNRDGSPVGTVTILRDVSQERALEQEKALFVANASHELRTPITNMMTRLYLLRKQPESAESHLQVLDEVARRMRTLVEDLLDHSRFERGVIPLDPKLMDIRTLVTQVVNLQVAEADKKLIDLISILPEYSLMSMVDPERMIQVITNLTMNAIHYTPEGGQVKVCVDSIQTAQGTERIRITVQDTGIGIPAALLPNLFKPFFRVSEKTKGTGLGLCIARDIVRAHDGDIVVESVAGAGSRFTVDIPAAVKASV